MRYKMRAFSAAQATELSKELGLHSIVAGVLAARGFDDPSLARAFLTPSLDKSWSDPEEIDGMRELTNRLEAAVRENRRICIFGDYDVDGITASALMFNILKELGSKAQVVLPLRAGEGYGLSEEALKRVYALEPEVLLTVDCGVSADEAVQELLSRGIEVLITDHHEGSGTLPRGVPLVDPKLDPQNPLGILAGVGVALKLAASLCARFGQPELWREQLDLAALGTIADCMPLVGENRAIVTAGLALLNKKSRMSLEVALETFGRNNGSINAESLSFGLIPRLNAAGRVSDPRISFDLLCSEDPSRVQKLALKLEALNTERRELEAILYEEAIEQAEQGALKRCSIVVGGQHWHDGVKGIVAGRLAREYGLPALVFSFEDDLAIGSGRSVGSIDLHKALSELSDLFIKFGGHKSAVGLTISRERMAEFAARIEEVLGDCLPEQFDPPQEVDCLVTLDRLSLEAVDELSALEPFGEENPEPVFMTRNALIKDVRFVGGGKRHLSLTLSDGMRELSAVWFNAPYDSLDEVPTKADALYRVQVDEWRGRRKVKAYLLGFSEEERAPGTSDDRAVAETELQNLLIHGSPEALSARLASTLLDNKVSLRKAQAKCLETLAGKKSTLSIMATGRGKSLIFQVHAARIALQSGQPSLFVYPLRSLINDQEYHLKTSFERLGLSAASLTGSTPPDEREALAQKVASGSLSVVLSTPEFIFANANKLALWPHFSFVAIDEAHHIATSSKHFRPDYTRLHRLRQLMPGATFLALSATSDKETTDTITQSLGIENIVVDTSKRPNLYLNDKRGVTNRLEELMTIVRDSPKSLIYVSSRGSTIDLSKQLRKELRELAPRIAFYNAALTAEDRLKVETALRNSELSCVVATSAFGEGINIPDVRDVVLYDLPYSLIDFNQMAGRAGRDGQKATIHLLAQPGDLPQMLEYLEDATQTKDTEVTKEELSSSARQLKLFADWLFAASPHGLLSSIQRPLTPFEELESV